MMSRIEEKKLLERKLGAIKLILVLGLGLFLLASPKIAVAYLFEDDFDSYPSFGSVCGHGDWGCFLTYDQDYLTTTTIAQSGNISIVRVEWGAYCLKKTGDPIENTGCFNFWIYPDDWATSTSFTWFSLDNSSESCAENNWLKIRLKAPTSTEELSVYGYGDSVENFLGNISKDEWSAIDICWSATEDVVKYRLNFENWLEFDLNNWSGTVDTFYWLTPVGGLKGNIYLDSITTLGVCASGDNCIFCSTQSDCEIVGCYWLEMPFPSVSACIPSSALIEIATGSHFDFPDYYATNSLYATPTFFISRLSVATQPFLSIISSWLENFSDYFDLIQAQEKGQEMGFAVPQARGYLVFFNSLFADLPLSEILLVYLVVLVGIIIFRIIRQIKKLIAF